MLSLVGYLAVVFNAISLAPEVLKALKTHHLRDVSWGMLFFLSLSSILWILYGIHVDDRAIIISDGLNMMMSLFLVILKFQYRKVLELA